MTTQSPLFFEAWYQHPANRAAWERLMGRLAKAFSRWKHERWRREARLAKARQDRRLVRRMGQRRGWRPRKAVQS